MKARHFDLIPFRAVRLALLGCVFALPLACVAERLPDGKTAGQPWTGEAGVRERTSDLMQRQARSETRGGRVFRVHQRPEFEVVEYETNSFPPVPPRVSLAAGWARRQR